MTSAVNEAGCWKAATGHSELSANAELQAQEAMGTKRLQKQLSSEAVLSCDDP